MRLLILPARPFAAEINDVVSEVPGCQVVGFVENQDPDHCRQTLEGLPVIWHEDLGRYANDHKAVCALSTTHRDRPIAEIERAGLQFPTLMHPSALVSARAEVGEGTVLNRATVVATHARIGRHVRINRGVLVGHHTTIGDYATLEPGVNVAGFCRIGSHAYLGMGAVVIDGITIGSRSVVAAGAVVIKDVPNNVLVAGVPAKIVKEQIDGK